MIGGMTCAGVEGKWYEGFCVVEGYGVGALWLVEFSI